ncbi:MAG: hypothetical protein LWW96_10885 [Acidovorax sp.]|uniref:hypothetical protein n=1 Tax=Acidovorax sp. TaxID=1872122 RepID=UPI0025B9B451|nr:hypothetical protein [Acidovorax sp.]MCE1192645.1 hypothetical protein [Acidovorax sp.]
MWFINGKRQVIELKRSTQEKRARRMATRPEPTIIGNCDSWIFIVGKKPGPGSPPDSIQGKLPGCNRNFINNLFTSNLAPSLNNLWVSCGAAVHCPAASRIVGAADTNIRIRVESRRYSIEFGE